MTIYYDTTAISYPSEGVIEVYNTADVLMATFSCEFLKKGHVDEWTYVLSACQTVVQEVGTLHLRRDNPYLDLASGRPTDPSLLSYESEPINLSGGTFPCLLVYVRSDDAGSQPSWSIGPRFKYKFRGPSNSENRSDTMSHSSRSTAQQSAFRGELWKRDGCCIVSGAIIVQAAHILPQSRPEYYREALGWQPYNLFTPSFGLLLDGSLHDRWDHGCWALYVDPIDPSVLIVHIFDSPQHQQYHGMRINHSRFRGLPARFPNRQLLDFHYRQCMIKHIRGFSVFPQWQAD